MLNAVRSVTNTVILYYIKNSNKRFVKLKMKRLTIIFIFWSATNKEGEKQTKKTICDSYPMLRKTESQITKFKIRKKGKVIDR